MITAQYLKISFSKYPEGVEFAELLTDDMKEKNKALTYHVYSEIMVDTDYFFDVSFKTFRLVLEPSSVEIFQLMKAQAPAEMS